MSRYTRNRNYKYKQKQYKTWNYESIEAEAEARREYNAPQEEKTEVENIMRPTVKRTVQQQKEFIAEVKELYNRGVASGEIAQEIGGKYNATVRDVYNVVYRYVLPEKRTEAEKKSAEQQNNINGAECVEENTKEEKPCLNDEKQEENGKPRLYVLMRSNPRKVQIRCDHAGCKVNIYIDNADDFRAIADEMMMILRLAKEG